LKSELGEQRLRVRPRTTIHTGAFGGGAP
jgi:hypothetical protein